MFARRKSATRLAAGAAMPLVLMAMISVGLTGCGGGASAAGGANGSAGAQGTGTVQQRARAVWLDYARCVRSHGFPHFPDPQVDSQGQVSFGTSSQIKQDGIQAQGACGSILNQLPPAVRGANTPVTAAQLHEERMFAACMRRNGLPEWPDPQPDGTFRLSATPYAAMGKTGPVLTGLNACRQYETFGGVRGS